MQVSRSLEYAVRSLVCLASSQGPMDLKAIAGREKIPTAYLAKIMRIMVQGGIVSSNLGRNGGYQLTRPARQIRLLEIYRLTEGNSNLIPCIVDGNFCSANEFCSQKPVWIKVEQAINEAFRKVTLSQMLPKPLNGGRSVEKRVRNPLP
jgi:Rrf2 family protein